MEIISGTYDNVIRDFSLNFFHYFEDVVELGIVAKLIVLDGYIVALCTLDIAIYLWD